MEAGALAIEERRVELRRGRTRTVFQLGDGAPLVWLHPADGVRPDHPLLAALARERTVLAPLAPGFADLAELDDVRDVHELAIEYDDLFEALGLEGVPVVGHSFGGMVAAELAAHYPSRVSKLVLIAPVGLWDDERPVLDIFAVPLPELPKKLFADERVAQAAFPQPAAGEEPDVEALVALAQGMTSVAKFMWPIPDRGLSRRLDRITADTLVVFGSEDALVPPSYADAFVAGIPRARKLIVPGAGHMAPVERPAVVADAIAAFLAE